MSDWVDKIDLNLTGQTFTDEKHTDVGASAFQLDHDWFWGGADLVIRTASGGGGTLLVEGTDYQLSVQDTDLTTRSGKTVYGKVQIITPGYQTGDLFFSGKYIADSNEAPDVNDIYAIINRRLGLNDIINGGFRFWQRGTSFAAVATNTYSADRWKYLKVGDMVHTITRDTGVPANDFPYSLKVDCTTVDAAIAAGDYCVIAQVIEGYNFQKYVGKYGTLSFWVRAPKTGIYCVAFRNSGSDRSYVSEFKVYAADTWEQKTITVQFSFSGGTWDYSNGSGLVVSWCLAAGATFQTTKDAWQTGDYLATSNQVNACDNIANDFHLAGVKFELGQKATDFVLADFSQDLARCQRYYEKSYNTPTDPGTVTVVGCTSWRAAFTSNYALISTKFQTGKRSVPAMALYSTATGAAGKIRDEGAAADKDGTAAYAGTSGFRIVVNNVAVTEGNELRVHWTADDEL